MPTLETDVRHEDDLAVIRLRGDIDGTAEDALLGAWADAAAGSRRVLLHFGATDYINSTGIALIVGLLARARAEHLEVEACGLSSHYREIFEITRLSDFMTIVPDDQPAVGMATHDGRSEAGGGQHDHE